jgi:cytochrome oxidase Cu insertion factor (SCO1/SenC/PrrC family)
MTVDDEAGTRDAGAGAQARRSSLAPIALGIAVLLLVAVTVRRVWTREEARAETQPFGDPDPPVTKLADFGAVADFTLTRKDGARFGLAELRGKVWVLDFVFTACSDCAPS